MPFCNVSSYQNGDGDESISNGTNIFYRTYGHGPVKVLLIIGLAGTHDSWGPQIKGLAGTVIPNDDESTASDRSNESDDGDGVEVCAFDNRGMGRSSVPIKKSEYMTRIMAKDAIALMDHLGWKKAHVFGHSMGAMIACKLAAMVPDRVSSLALLNVTGGGYECIPKVNAALIELIKASKSKISLHDRYPFAEERETDTNHINDIILWCDRGAKEGICDPCILIHDALAK